MTQPDRNPDVAVVFSGGLDSTTLVYGLLSEGMTPHLLSFNYGQRHKRELEYAKKTADLLGLRHDIVDLTGITHLISNSALTSHPSVSAHRDDDIEVPEGHYAEDNMKATVVPNRNMIMLSIACGVAVNNNYLGVFTGVHAGDHFVYPDCRPMFIETLGACMVIGNEGFGKVEKLGNPEGVKPFLYAPYVNMTKEGIAYEALKLDVPLQNTWSCYKGGEIHCGKCGTCVERLEAIDGAIKNWDEYKGNYVGSTIDPTKYEDSEFWKEAIRNAKQG